MSGASAFDIRIPIGVLFVILGALLVVFGVMTLSDAPLYARSMDININLWWGLAMVLFGAVMLLLGARARRIQGARPAMTSPEGVAIEDREHGLGLEQEGPRSGGRR
jgi:hypothetical protein